MCPWEPSQGGCESRPLASGVGLARGPNFSEDENQNSSDFLPARLPSSDKSLQVRWAGGRGMEEMAAARIGPTESSMCAAGSQLLANQALKAASSTEVQGAPCWARWELQLPSLHPGLPRRA